jgi:predicted metal-binding transcription factor (methanogenesis marker protein 9)
MFNKKVQYRLPKSVDEAAELLLSDLLLQHLQTLVQMSEDEYDRLCDKLAPYLLEEFRVWQGNNDLLDSCYNDSEDETVDPTRIILNRIKKILQDLDGFLVIT